MAKTRKFRNEDKTQRNCFSGKIFNGSGNKMKRLRRYQMIKGEKHFYYNWGCDHEEVREKDIQYAFTVMMIKLVKFRTILVRPLYDGAIEDNTVLTAYQKAEVITLWKFLSRRNKPAEFDEHLFNKFHRGVCHQGMQIYNVYA